MAARATRSVISPEDLVLHLIKQVRQDLDHALSVLPVRLTRLQFGVLYVLRSLGDGEATITELAGLSCVEPPTLVEAIHGLERKKLVAKTRDATDRRRLPIRLTPLGLRLLKGSPHPAAGILKQARRKAGAQKFNAFLEVLVLLAENPRS